MGKKTRRRIGDSCTHINDILYDSANDGKEKYSHLFDSKFDVSIVVTVNDNKNYNDTVSKKAEMSTKKSSSQCARQ